MEAVVCLPIVVVCFFKLVARIPQLLQSPFTRTCVFVCACVRARVCVWLLPVCFVGPLLGRALHLRLSISLVVLLIIIIPCVTITILCSFERFYQPPALKQAATVLAGDQGNVFLNQVFLGVEQEAGNPNHHQQHIL